MVAGSILGGREGGFTLARRLRAAAAVWRVPILLLAALLFTLGLFWSISALELGDRTLNWTALALALVVMVPASGLNAAEFQLCGKAARVAIGFRRALAISSLATLSNLLPLPGALAVRGVALTRSGASLGATGGVVLAAAVLWATLSVGLAFAAVATSWTMVVAAGACIAAAALPLVWIARAAGAGVAAGFLAVRLGLIALTVLRLWLCFAAIGADARLAETTVYAVASLAGAVVGIVPAGLGISEGAAALLAIALGGSPAAAFVALSLNRLIGLAAAGLVVLANGAWLNKPV